jgi:hypothetical protein
MYPGGALTPPAAPARPRPAVPWLHNFHLLYLFTEAGRAAGAPDPLFGSGERTGMAIASGG